MTGPTKYVADSLLGGRQDLGDFIGSQAAETGNATEEYWPRIPPSYGPPPAHLEKAVKEVGYITLLMVKTTAPDNGIEDVSCVSDLLLSLETRDDITELTLEYTSWEHGLGTLAHLLKENPEIDNMDIGSRATALKQYWKNIPHRDPHRGPSDLAYPPLLSAPPNKPQGWKLRFTAKGEEEAEKYYQALKTKRKYYYRCFQAEPPMPMGWAPKTGDAWAKTARDKVQSGDLFHSRDWSPIWMDFGLATIGFWPQMKTAVLTPAEIEEYNEARNTMREMEASFQGRNLQREGILAD